MHENRELKLALEFIRETDTNIFLTGKAGTGKTTFLQQLKGNISKRMIITAPTGVAAINAGGVTLHSFFQLPFGPFIPGSKANEKTREQLFRFSRKKKRIIQSLDLLVIDEISMVRADLLDRVDAALKLHRKNNQPFGGLQLLMIGDLHQLPPVAKQDEWELLRQYYESVYFFSSHALAGTELVSIELQHIYRQSDAHFIELLNRVRNNKLDAQTIAALNRRYIKNFVPKGDQGFITMTTHNNKAENINKARFTALKEKSYSFDADIKGDFPEHSYPAPATLYLKKGAQVMFLRNDPSPEKEYYNGKIGKVSKIKDKEVHVICPDDSQEIVVETLIWDNIKYSIDQETMRVQEEVTGSFEQFPLKLAWAITIHKSQGLTFDKALIDASSAFTHGQVYVALSRCKNFEGMVLSSPIPSSGINIDEHIIRFTEKNEQNSLSDQQLHTSKISYQQKLLLECFDFQVLKGRLSYLIQLLSNNAGVIKIYGIANAQEIWKLAVEHIFTVSEKFKLQLHKICANPTLPETDPYTRERSSKASQWFMDKFSLTFNDLAHNFYIETDNKELDKRISTALNNFKQEFFIKIAGVKSCENGFSPSKYLSAVCKAQIDFNPEKMKTAPVPVYTESQIEHEEVFQQLKDWRAHKAKQDGVERFQILHQRILIQIAVNLPDNRADLFAIQGIGKKTFEKHGKDILTIVAAYRKKYGINKVSLPDNKKDNKKMSETKTNSSKEGDASNTKQISFNMFQKGLSIAEIAKERGLVESTIEGHLGFFVEQGEIDINKILSPDQQKEIEACLARVSDNSLKTVRTELEERYSYGEIKFVIAHQKYMEISV